MATVLGHETSSTSFEREHSLDSLSLAFVLQVMTLLSPFSLSFSYCCQLLNKNPQDLCIHLGLASVLQAFVPLQSLGSLALPI